MSTESFTKNFTLDEKGTKSLLDIMGFMEYHILDKRTGEYLTKDDGERVTITHKHKYEEFYRSFEDSPLDCFDFVEVEERVEDDE